MPENDFEQLVSLWLAGRLDEGDSQLLESELACSKAARQRFLRYTKLDAALHDIAATTSLAEHAEQLADEHKRQEQTESGPLNKSVVGRISSASSPTTISIAAWSLALATVVFLAVSLPSFFGSNQRQASLSEKEGSAQILTAADGVADDAAEVGIDDSLHRPPAPVATLSLAEGALWNESPLELGQTLLEGETIVLQSGNARLSVGFGAEIVANAPFSLTFLTPSQVQLHYGRVAVDVAPWAKGFTVVTDDMNIVDLGTTFTVSASPGTKTEATVLKGLVRVHSSSTHNVQRRGRLVTEGQQISIDDKGWFEPVRQEDVKPLLAGLDFGATGAYRPVQLNNTGLGLSIGDEDQHWRVVTGPDGDLDSPQFATVCVPERGYLPNRPDSSQWVSITDWQTAKPNSIYTFRTEFDLKDYDLNTMQLFGRFLADNGVSAVRVNGSEVQVNSWVDNVILQPFGDLQFRFVNITDGLVHGRNTIEIDVRNGMMRNAQVKKAPMMAIPNPMALRVEWYAFGRQNRLARAGGNAALLPQDRSDPFSQLTSTRIMPEI